MNSEEMKKNCLFEDYPKLEGSTVALLKEAERQGINYEIIDEEHCFVKLSKGKRTEYVVQATKTSRDTYVFPYLVNDKEFTKQLLRTKKLNVPDGIVIEKDMLAKDINHEILKYAGKPVVIKPRTTNCGVGITVFKDKASESEIKNAVKYAFKFDDNVLIEEYAEGKEYRFVIINNKCISVVHRRNASVVGDGKKTIHELIIEKNKEPWHEILKRQIQIDEPLKIYLKGQNLSLNSIPKEGERVFLRKNSNCCTGGESIDVTEIMPDYFKKIAIKATKAFGAKICGVDILIDDMNKHKYSIVEVNDNPGIGINEWPYEGKGEKIGLEILKLLKFID